MADHDHHIPGDGALYDGALPEPPDEPEETAEERSRGARVLRAVLIALGSLVGLVVLLVVLFFLALQTNWGGTRFADFLFGLFNPFDESYTEYEELRGNFLSWIEFHDLRITRVDTFLVDTVQTDPLELRWAYYDSVLADTGRFDAVLLDTVHLAQADTLRLRYNLLSLFRRHVDFKEVYLADPDLHARQNADSTWDLLQAFARDTSAVDTTNVFTFGIEEARITSGRLVAEYYPPWADSTLHVQGVNLLAHDLAFGDGVQVFLDTLQGRYMLPGQDYWTRLEAGGSLLDNRLALSGLQLQSPNSFVTGAGTLRLPEDDEDEIDDINFRLRADPIAFRDLRLFAPNLNPEATATFEVTVGGALSVVRLDAEGRLGDGAHFALDGVLSPQTEGPLEYAFEGELRSFDPGYLTEGPSETPILLNTTFDVELQGTALEALDGTVAARLFDSRFGNVFVDQAVANARFDEGVAYFEDSRIDLPRSGPVFVEGSIQPFAETPSYDLALRLRSFNIGTLLDETSTATSDITGTIAAEGTGFDVETAEVAARIELDPSTINDYRVEDANLRLDLNGGDLDFGVRALFPDGFIAANGQAQLGGDVITYSVDRGRFENVDLAALLGQPEASSLYGNFNLEGRGTDPQTLDLQAHLDLFDASYGTYDVAAADLNVRLRNGQLDVGADADLVEAGSFDFDLRARPFDDTETLQISEARFRNVDLGLLLQNPELTTDLTGTASFVVRGFDPERMYLDGRFTLNQSTVNEQAIAQATVLAELRRGNLTFDAEVDIPEGHARLAGTAQPFRDVPAYTIREGSFSGINLAAFTGNPNLESDLNGTFTAEGRGLDPETLNLEGRLELTRSRLNEQLIQSAALTGSWRDGTLDFDVRLDVPEGRTRLAGTIQPLLEVPTYTIREGTFAGLNVGALTGNPDWQTSLYGSLSIEGQGFDPETADLDATIDFQRSVINDAVLQAGTLEAALDDGLVRLGTDLTFEEGRARVNATGRFFDETPTYEAEGTLSNVDVAGILGNDTLTAQFTADFAVEGVGLDAETMFLEGLITSRDARYEGVDVDSLYADFLLEDGLLRLDSLLLRSNVADLRGAGRIALFDTTATSDFSFVADVEELAPIRPLIGAEQLALESGRLEGRVYGPPGRLQFDVTGEVESFIYDDISIAGFEGRLAGELGPDRELTLAEAGGEIEALSLPRLGIEGVDFDVRYVGDELVFTAEAVIDRNRDLRVEGRVDLAPGSERILLETLNLRLADETWELLQPATITYGEQYRVSNFLLYTDNQQIAVDGIVDPTGRQNLIVTIENVRLDPITDLLDYEGLGATVDGSLVLEGVAAAPNLTGNLQVDLRSRGDDVGDMRLALRYDSLRMNVEAHLLHEEGGELAIDGYIPLDLRLGAAEGDDVPGQGLNITTAQAPETGLNLVVTADSFSIGWIEPFLDPETIGDLEGILAGRFEIGGSLGSPELDGSAVLADGHINLPEFDVTYSNIRATFEMVSNQVIVEEATMESGGGTLRANGTINFAELTLGEFDIDMVADDFLAVDSDEYEAVVDAGLNLSGTFERPVLTGNLEILSAEINLTDETTSPELANVELSEEDLLTVSQRFGIRITEEDTTTFDFYEALAMELDIRMERNTWLRSRAGPEMAIQFSGDLDVSKEPFQDAQIFGTIEVVPEHSRIVQFGKRFDLTSGTLTFNGDAANPFIDVEAEYQVPHRRTRESEVVIVLAVEGRLQEQLDIEFSSRNPAGLDLTDIISYIATGQPASQSLRLGEAAGGLALDQLASFIEGFAGAELGLDVVEIEHEGLQGTTLTAGKYVTPRLFVSISQPISFGNDPSAANAVTTEKRRVITIEYEVFNWLLLRLLRRGSVVHLNLLWEYAY